LIFCWTCHFYKSVSLLNSLLRGHILKKGAIHVLRDLEERNELKLAGDKIKKGVMFIPKHGERLYSGTRYVFKTVDRFRELVADLSAKIPSIQQSQFKYPVDYHEKTDETENLIEKNKEIVALENRCKEMRSLQDGWYHGEGTSYSDEMMNTVDSVIRRLLDYEVPGPIFGPSPDGSVEIEWQEEGIIVTLTEDCDSIPRFKFEVLTKEKESSYTLNDEEFIAFINEKFN